MLDSLIDSGRIVDLMALFVVLEIVALGIYWARVRRGVAPLQLLVNIGAGGSLMLALRAALAGDGNMTIATFLMASLVFHVADLWVRWQR